MPFKSHKAATDWNRAYQRRRSAAERQTRTTLEEQIINLVRREPRRHDALSIYYYLLREREEGYPVKMVERATRDLLKARILSWDGRTIPSRLVLNEMTNNPFAAQGCNTRKDSSPRFRFKKTLSVK